MFNQEMPDSQEQSPLKKSNSLLIIIISALIVLLLAGGGVYAYYNYYQTPERVLQKMISNLATVKSMEYSGNIDTQIDLGNLLGGGGLATSTPKKTSYLLTSFTGSSDLQNTADPRGYFTFNIKTNALTETEFSLGLELRVVNKIIYVKLSDLPALGFFDATALKNQWIKFDTEAMKKDPSLAEMAKQYSKDQMPAVPTAEQFDKLKLAFWQSGAIKITEKLPNEKVAEVDSHHYRYAIDREGLKKFLLAAGKIFDEKELTPEQLTELNKGLEKMEMPTGEIWVGQKDLLPHQITLDINIKPTDQSSYSGKIAIKLGFKNFNQTKPIEAPAESKTLEEVSASLFQMPPIGISTTTQNFNNFGMESPALDTTIDPYLDTDKDSLTDQMEAGLKTDPTKTDTDGDGFTDYEEVMNGFNPNGPGKLTQ